MSARNKFCRQEFFPQGWETIVSQFLELFHRYGYIYKPLAGGSWYSANEKWKLSDTEILKAIAGAHPKNYLGCRSGKTTRFAVLDIDANSKYHSKRYFTKLLKALSNAGLTKSSLFRSSTSGGWHLYLFFDELINSADLRRRLVKLLSVNDFQIAKGALEVFPHPSQGSVGMGLRLPLQHGWAWLNKETLEVEYLREELSATKALELFIDALEGDANSYKTYAGLSAYTDSLVARKEALGAYLRNSHASNVVSLVGKKIRDQNQSEHLNMVRAVFNEVPPGIIVDNWYKGREFHLQGLTGPSQRADAISCLSHYLFYGDPSRNIEALGYGYEQEREWAIRQFLSSKHGGYSKDINRDRSEAFAQIERATQWKPVHKRSEEATKYISQRPISWVRENARRKLDARERIKDALKQITELRRPFTTKELQERAACSRSTLYKHADLWRQQYEDLARGFFAICTHEYNAVEGVASQESQPPLTSLKENVPPGLLAARRIAYEISVRNRREEKNRAKEQVADKLNFEKVWREKVNMLEKVDEMALPLDKLDLLLENFVLLKTQAMCEEDYLEVSRHIEKVQKEFRRRKSWVLLDIANAADGAESSKRYDVTS